MASVDSASPPVGDAHQVRGKEARGVMRTRNEHTLASAWQVSGRGYWSGREVRVTCRPANVGTGVVFVRSDLPGRPECPALSKYADSVQFRTNLRRGEARFEMIEHLMAALVGLEIDNCLVEVDGEELPGLDGSSQGYVDAIQNAGLIIQPATRRMLSLNQTVRVESGDGAWITAEPVDYEATYRYELDYGTAAVIRPQTHSCQLTPRCFIRQLSQARTFVTLDQAETLRQSGIANHVTNQDLLVIGPTGPVENDFRYRDECARHKTLDLVGDIGLVGMDIRAAITSHRGGHRLNAMMASALVNVANTSSPSQLAAPIVCPPLRSTEFSSTGPRRNAA